MMPNSASSCRPGSRRRGRPVRSGDPERPLVVQAAPRLVELADRALGQAGVPAGDQAGRVRGVRVAPALALLEPREQAARGLDVVEAAEALLQLREIAREALHLLARIEVVEELEGVAQLLDVLAHL